MRQRRIMPRSTVDILRQITAEEKRTYEVARARAEGVGAEVGNGSDDDNDGHESSGTPHIAASGVLGRVHVNTEGARGAHEAFMRRPSVNADTCITPGGFTHAWQDASADDGAESSDVDDADVSDSC